MRRFPMLFVAPLLAFCATASGQDCVAETSQTGMNLCAQQAYEATDGELNAAYRQIDQRMADDPDGRKRLVAAQRAWIAFRDAECAFSTAPAEEGSIHPMLVADCLATLTQARLEQFEIYLDCEEGDLGCPVPAP